MTDWRTWSYAREHLPTGNRLLYSHHADGSERYVVLVRDGDTWRRFSTPDRDEALRIAEGRE